MSDFNSTVVKLGGKIELNDVREIAQGVELGKKFHEIILKISWPKDVLYKWKDENSEIGMVIYSVDLGVPIERIDKTYYENGKYDKCIVIAGTDHGLIVIPPSEVKSDDPFVCLIDDQIDDEYKKWLKRKCKYSEFIKNLQIHSK